MNHPEPYLTDLGNGQFAAHTHLGVTFNAEQENTLGQLNVDRYGLTSYEIVLRPAGSGPIYRFVGPKNGITQLVRHTIN